MTTSNGLYREIVNAIWVLPITVCHSLDTALDALNADRGFLLEGGVFNHDFIDSFIELKQEEVDRLRMATHPMEFELYYSL